MPYFWRRTHAQQAANDRLGVGAIGTSIYTDRYTGAGEHPGQGAAIGHRAGQLGDMLSSISDHYDDRVETSIEGLSSIIEPMMIVLIGGLIALILVAMFLPVFHLGGAIRRGHM